MEPKAMGAQSSSTDVMEPVTETSGAVDRSWTELRALSKELGTKTSNDECKETLEHYGVMDDEGNFKNISFTVTKDWSIPNARIVDIPEVNGGYALTFIFSEPVAWRGIEDGETGSWNDSSLCTWLNGAFFESLPDELSSNIATTEVISYSNGQRYSDQERLWLLSITQIEGTLPEGYFGTSAPADSVANYNDEGAQLEWFHQEGISPENELGGLGGADKIGSSVSGYWTRSQIPPGTAVDGKLHFLVVDSTDRATPGPVDFTNASDSTSEHAVFPRFTLKNTN